MADIKFESVKMKLSSGKIKEDAVRQIVSTNEAQGWKLVSSFPIFSGMLIKRERLVLMFQK